MDGFMRVLNYHPLDGGELNRYLWFFIKMPKEIAGLEELGLEIEHAVSKLAVTAQQLAQATATPDFKEAYSLAYPLSPSYCCWLRQYSQASTSFANVCAFIE